MTTDTDTDTDCHEAGTLGGIRRPIGARVVDGAKFQAALRSSRPRRDQFVSLMLMLVYAATAIGLIAMAAVVVLAAINLSR